MKQFSTIKHFTQKYPNFLTEGGLRHLIFNEDLNGFGVCIRRVGRRILLDEEALFAWVDQQKGGARHG